MKGEVVGIDNQIYSDTKGGGSIGIGFAIPSNDAQLLVQQLHKYGDIRLGWLGMRLRNELGSHTGEGDLVSRDPSESTLNAKAALVSN